MRKLRHQEIKYLVENLVERRRHWQKNLGKDLVLRGGMMTERRGNQMRRAFRASAQRPGWEFGWDAAEGRWERKCSP